MKVNVRMGIWLDVNILAARASVVITNTTFNWSTVRVNNIPIDCFVEVH